jgi:TM2 domain-containing membrane protein YozV
MSETQYVVQTSSKSKVVALILCIFLGGLGIHRFYVGKVGTGILYLFTGALLGIGWLIDIIKIATGTFTDGAGVAIRQ